MTVLVDRDAGRQAAAPSGALPEVSDAFERQVADARRWFEDPRFAGITRLHTARDVAEQQGSIVPDHAIARDAAEGFHALLRDLFAQGRQVTTFGPYSPSQAVIQKRAGLGAIYLGGWATSAKGSQHEDPGPDLASYPLSAVPDEAAAIVRALLTADRNQHFARSRLTAAERAAAPAVDYRPFIIADADTGHGGEAHVRNLIRRFVEAGVPGYHIEDQRPGAKKCGHQDGKVLVSQSEQIKRLNAARFQLDIMRVPGIIVARTDAEAATLIDDRSDERDGPFLLGATTFDVPSFRVGFIEILEQLHDLGVQAIRGHLLYAIPETDRLAARMWLDRVGLLDEIADRVHAGATRDADALLDEIDARYVQVWSDAANVMTIGDARALGLPWDPELPRTPDGYYRVRGGIDYAIARSLAAAPFADLLWMETKTADLADARRYAEAIHAVHPDKMLAYNLSPSFNWDTTGLSDEEMRRFPDELGKLGFVFDFITYGGHQVDGLATEEFAADLRRDGMLALARLQRRLRMIDSPYRGPQALVGGPRLDAALVAASGRTASTRAMGKASTHHQHLVPIEASPSLLDRWLRPTAHPDDPTTSDPATGGPGVRLVPTAAGSDHVRLLITGPGGGPVLEVVHTVIEDADGRATLLVARTRGAPDTPSTWPHFAMLYLLHRSGAESVQIVGPTSVDTVVADGLLDEGVLRSIDVRTDPVLVATVDRARVAEAVATADQRSDRRPVA